MNLDQALGTGWSLAIHPDDRQWVADKWHEAAAKCQVFREEYRLQKPDGTVSWVLGQADSERMEDGKVTGYVGTITDITGQKQVEAELNQHRHHMEEIVLTRTSELAAARDAAEAANRAKTMFLANMSHELRTPMHAIMGLTDLASRRVADPQAIDWLTKGRASAQHLLAIINDVLDVAKIEADQLPIDESPFSFSEVIDGSLRMLEGEALRKGLGLSCKTPPGIPDGLRGDAMRLRQIVLNFVSNAIKFSTKGEITVQTHVVAEDHLSVMLRIEVADEGIGMSPEQQARLFKPFMQGDGSITRKYGGTGLGLFISKRIANLMDGDVGVVSKEGHGSTFWVTVRLRRAGGYPQADVSSGASSVREILVKRYSGIRVLVVDDDPSNREVATALISDVGLIPEAATNGKEAVDKARQGIYALILMDVQMPVMNGLEATRAIRLLPAMHDIPILGITANAFAEDRAACFAAGMSAHLAKPLTSSALYSTMLRWLQKSADAVRD